MSWLKPPRRGRCAKLNVQPCQARNTRWGWGVHSSPSQGPWSYRAPLDQGEQIKLAGAKFWCLSSRTVCFCYLSCGQGGGGGGGGQKKDAAAPGFAGPGCNRKQQGPQGTRRSFPPTCYSSHKSEWQAWTFLNWHVYKGSPHLTGKLSISIT